MIPFFKCTSQYMKCWSFSWVEWFRHAKTHDEQHRCWFIAERIIMWQNKNSKNLHYTFLLLCDEVWYMNIFHCFKQSWILENLWKTLLSLWTVKFCWRRHGNDATSTSRHLTCLGAWVLCFFWKICCRQFTFALFFHLWIRMFSS